MTENNPRAEHKDSSKIILEFRKLVFGGLSFPIPTHPGGFHLLGILSKQKCTLCPKSPSSLSSVNRREATEPAFAAASRKYVCVCGGGV